MTFTPFNLFRGFEAIGEFIVSFFGIDGSAFEDMIDDITENHVDKMMSTTDTEPEEIQRDASAADCLNDELSESMHKSPKGYLNLEGKNVQLEEIDIEMSVMN